MFLFCSKNSLRLALLLVFSCCVVGRGMGAVSPEDKKNVLKFAGDGNLDEIKKLFERCNDKKDQELLLEVQDKEGDSILSHASFAGKLEMVKWLVEEKKWILIRKIIMKKLLYIGL